MSMISMTQRLLLALAPALACGGCAATNYVEPDVPRYAGGAPAPMDGDTLKLVSFNIKYADEIDGAIRLLTTHPDLSEADIILLQEMDQPGTERIAEALGLAFVYYPAVRWHDERGDFGNAILSRWPIESDQKLILPHRAFNPTRTHRIATAATLRVHNLPVRVYSTHLATQLDTGAYERRHQLRTILDDAEAYERVVIAGDMNDEGVGIEARKRGYRWPTRGERNTGKVLGFWWGAWDHLFLKGLETPAAGAAGVVLDVGDVSDHRPIWAVAILR
jgi:endonuclease/exonuclease/phosphatase family metal-dependent hydrolase